MADARLRLFASVAHLLLLLRAPTASAQLFQRHHCTDIADRLNAVNSACGSSPVNCTLDCADVLLPLVHNTSCETALNTMADVSGSDTTRDGKATAVYHFADKCSKQLAANITDLKARGCSVDDTKVVAFPDSKSTSTDPIGQRRNMFSVVDPTEFKTCPRASFNTKLAELKTRCCAQKGNCAGGLPQNCSFDCAQFYTGFFQNCSSFIKSADATHYAKYVAFAKTCGRLPTAAMVAAVKGAKCSKECHYGWFADGYDIDITSTCSAHATSVYTCEKLCENSATCVRTTLTKAINIIVV